MPEPRQASYSFVDAFGKRQGVDGTPEAINALMVVFVRLDALEHIHGEIAKLLNLVRPRDGGPRA